MKYFITLLFFILVLPLGVRLAQASSTIHYPIFELGNCRDKQECFYFCEVPDNQDLCSTYAQSVSQSSVLGDTASSSPYTFPIAQLGSCASKEECIAYCNKIENRSSCISFSKSRQLVSPESNDSSRGANINSRLMEEAKSTLGCDYATTCHDYCNLPENKTKCEQFIKSFYGKNSPVLRQSISPKPESNTSAITADCTNRANREKCIRYGSMCGTFCNKNQGFCNGNIPTINPSFHPVKPSIIPMGDSNPIMKKIQEISGCTTSLGCSAYCKNHADICQEIYNSLKPSPNSFLPPPQQ